jgi:hypothetical protein
MIGRDHGRIELERPQREPLERRGIACGARVVHD